MTDRPDIIDEQACVAEPETEDARTIRKLRAELDHFIKSGIIEVAVRNPSVAEYMAHWEARAEAAEARVAELTEVLHTAEEYFDNRADAEYFTDSPTPVPNKEMSILCEIRAALAGKEGTLTVAGMRVRSDDTVPEGEVHIRDKDGRLLGAITGLAGKEEG